ncbi:MAG: hypothetical protein IPK22_11135 [Verrucomicrobiaceae bacterium]|nr:hypothetical protein [Verrucomicrobiaceae bacterium]
MSDRDQTGQSRHPNRPADALLEYLGRHLQLFRRVFIPILRMRLQISHRHELREGTINFQPVCRRQTSAASSLGPRRVDFSWELGFLVNIQKQW